MSKVASYLRGHIAGEVSTRDDIRTALSADRGVLEIKPEMVVYPRNTNDIRKIVRFAWQLAEKGHVMPVTVRGAGMDATGAAIGKGALVVTAAHLNHIFEYDAKQKLVRLQPGVTVGAIEQALGLGGVGIMSLADAHPFSTIGGAIASATSGRYAGKYGTIGGAIDQLEVVLANGDVLQTGRINKKELSRKKGLQSFEGDIYRGIDGVIEEYADVIDSIDANDVTGYNMIADVKRKDGSFDLTPLFVGSQGTLGVISEMIMRTEPYSPQHATACLTFANGNAARDALDVLAAMKPAFLEYFDAAIFDAAAKEGRLFGWYKEAADTFTPAAVVVIGFDDANAHHREKALKKLVKRFGQAQDVAIMTADGDEVDELDTVLDVVRYTAAPDTASHAAPALYEGFYVPTERLEDFMNALSVLATKEHLALPLAGHALTNTYGIYPSLELKKVGDKQKVFKLISELTDLVESHGGTMLTEGGEGRIKARDVYAKLDPKLVEMYTAIRKVCDPYGTLNPGVKQVNELTALAGQIRDEHNLGQAAQFGL